MKQILIIIFFTFLLVSIGCKSEEEKIETTPKHGDTYVLPPQQQQQTIQKQENLDPKIAAELKVVANALKPGTFAITNCGMGQLMFWKPSGPNGIFIGMAGLPRGVTAAFNSGLSKVSP